MSEDRYYRVFVDEDGRFTAVCDEYPRLRSRHHDPVGALEGLIDIISEVEDDDE